MAHTTQKLSIALMATVCVFSAGAAFAKEAPALYALKDKAEVCKKGYTRVEVEFIKANAAGAVTLKYKDSAPMGPIPKKFATQYATLKAGDAVCLPGAKD